MKRMNRIFRIRENLKKKPVSYKQVSQINNKQKAKLNNFDNAKTNKLEEKKSYNHLLKEKANEVKEFFSFFFE